MIEISANKIYIEEIKDLDKRTFKITITVADWATTPATPSGGVYTCGGDTYSFITHDVQEFERMMLRSSKKYIGDREPNWIGGNWYVNTGVGLMPSEDYYKNIRGSGI